MTNLKIRQGATLTLTIQSDDDTAETLRFVARKENESSVIDETANFADVDGNRLAVIETSDTNIPVDVYEYMLTVTYSDDTVVKLPEGSDCEGDDCELPTLTICESIDQEVS